MREPLQLGRYSLFAQLAAGGMATVYLGRLNGEVGFGRTVAIKRLHAHLAKEREFVSMFLDEAHMATRIQHPNVVPTLDIVSTGDELFLVMEYVQGETLAVLLRTRSAAGRAVPVPIAASIAIGFLSGLHAAHEAKDEQGHPLGVVHRDVSPQNVLVGADGVARLLDFGVARASARLSTTRTGEVKGKVRYMSPEQLHGDTSRLSDVYAAGVVFWESLTGQRMVRGEGEAEVIRNVLSAEPVPPSSVNPEVPPEVDRIVLRALARDRDARWPTALEMAQAIDASLRPASSMSVAAWVQRTAGETLEQKAALVSLAESGSEPRGNVDALRVSGHLSPVERTATDVVAAPPTLPVTDDVATLGPRASVIERPPHTPASSSLKAAAGVVAIVVLVAGAALFLARPQEGPVTGVFPAGPSRAEGLDASMASRAPVIAPVAPRSPTAQAADDDAANGSTSVSAGVAASVSAAKVPSHSRSPHAPTSKAPPVSASAPVGSNDLSNLLDTR